MAPKILAGRQSPTLERVAAELRSPEPLRQRPRLDDPRDRPPCQALGSDHEAGRGAGPLARRQPAPPVHCALIDPGVTKPVRKRPHKPQRVVSLKVV